MVQSEPPPVVWIFITFGPLLAVAVWLQKNARRTGVADVQGWGLILWIAWPIAVPWYAFTSLGRPGWRLTL